MSRRSKSSVRAQYAAKSNTSPDRIIKKKIGFKGVSRKTSYWESIRPEDREPGEAKVIFGSGPIKTLPCRICQKKVPYIAIPNGPHTEARCSYCSKHIKFLKK